MKHEASNNIVHVHTVPDKASNSNRQDTDSTKIAVGRLILITVQRLEEQRYAIYKHTSSYTITLRYADILYTLYSILYHTVPYYAISYFGALLNRRGVDLLAADLIAFIDGVYLYVQHSPPVVSI